VLLLATELRELVKAVTRDVEAVLHQADNEESKLFCTQIPGPSNHFGSSQIGAAVRATEKRGEDVPELQMKLE
jgi:hypothetical protein